MPGFPRGARFYIHPVAGVYVTGTWTDAIVSNVAVKQKTAAAETPTILYPLEMQFRIRPGAKIKINRIKIFYEIATAACTAVAVRLRKGTLPPDATAMSSTAVTFTKDISDANMLTAAHHTVMITPSVDLFIDDNLWVHLELDLTAAATTVLRMKGALVEYKEPPEY
jgi:hypothetical protein